MRRCCWLLIWLSVVSTACACNIPVFRYALERWRVDPCEVIVFHHGELTAEQQRRVRSLAGDSAEATEHANIDLVRSDLSKPDAPHRSLWMSIQSQAPTSLPYVLVRTKLGPGRLINGWHGPLSGIHPSGLLQSPARADLSRRLLAGHSIVWVLITSKDEHRNELARRLLSENLDLLAAKIELPEGIGLPGSELHSEIPLLLKFSLLEIDRADPKEQFLVKLFTGFQPEAVAEGEPLIIPVFGRGRALEVIPAGDMNPSLMEQLAVFLSGACSCQVKEQNPGFDLLLSVDWNAKLFGQGVAPPPERTTRDRETPILLNIPPGG